MKHIFLLILILSFTAKLTYNIVSSICIDYTYVVIDEDNNTEKEIKTEDVKKQTDFYESFITFNNERSSSINHNNYFISLLQNRFYSPITPPPNLA